MILKLFTQPTCPRCPAAKKVVAQVENRVKVENYDVKTEDGLAVALEYDILATPSIVITSHDGEILGQWSGQTQTIEELNRVLK